MTSRFAASVALLLSLVATHASAQVNSEWEPPANALTLPVTEPIAVEIYLPQEDLYTLAMPTNPMMYGGGALGVVIQTVVDKNRTRQQDPVAAALNATMPAVDYGKVLQESFARHIGAPQFANIKRVTLHRDTPKDVEAATPGDPNEQILVLHVRYYLSPALWDLRIAMTARLGPRSIVTVSPSAKRSPTFAQEFIYDVPGNLKSFSSAERRAAVWTGMGGPAVSNHIRSGMDGVMSMLASELANQPRSGRIPGKQIPWGEGQSGTYGVVESQGGGRAWIRLRNGRLLSLADDDRRLPKKSDREEAPVTPATATGAHEGAKPAAGTPGPSDTPNAGASRAVLPLKPGVYVLAGSGCSAPANAGVRFYDGRGISGSATHACRTQVRSRRQDTYIVEQSCIDTPSGDGPRRSESQTITVHDALTFTLVTADESARFRHCPMDALPGYLRQRLSLDSVADGGH